MTNAFSCMSPGSDKTPTAWRDSGAGAYSAYTGAYPRISIWHGTNDYTVKNTNHTEAVEQWTAVHGIDMTEDVNETVAGYPHKVYKDAAGKALVESYAITGMGHGTPVDPAFKFPGTTVACGTAGALRAGHGHLLHLVRGEVLRAGQLGHGGALREPHRAGQRLHRERHRCR